MEFKAAVSTHRDPEGIVSDLVANGAVERPDLAILFVSPHHEDACEQLVQRVLEKTGASNLIGCTGESIIGPDAEFERMPAVALWTASLPGVRIMPFVVDIDDVRNFETVEDWSDRIGVERDQSPSFIVLPEPFTFGPAVEHTLGVMDQLYPGSAIVGGLPSGGAAPGENRMFLNEQVLRQGLVGVSMTGPVAVEAVVSQGCRPIGEPYVVTRAENNVIRELRGRPALEVLKSVYEAAGESDQALIREGRLHIGSAIDETRSKLGPGDFLIRNMMDVIDDSAIAVAAYIRPGQTVQFHVRDADSADKDMQRLLHASIGQSESAPQGGLLFSCNGRGTRMFDNPNHDIGIVNAEAPSCAVAGFFAAGEIGPVGGKTFVHGLTSSLVLFRERS